MMWRFEFFMRIACRRTPLLGKDDVSVLSMRPRHGDVCGVVTGALDGRGRERRKVDRELATASPSFGGHEQEQEKRETGVYGARTRNLRRDRAAL